MWDLNATWPWETLTTWASPEQAPKVVSKFQTLLTALFPPSEHEGVITSDWIERPERRYPRVSSFSSLRMLRNESDEYFDLEDALKVFMWKELFSIDTYLSSQKIFELDQSIVLIGAMRHIASLYYSGDTNWLIEYFTRKRNANSFIKGERDILQAAIFSRDKAKFHWLFADDQKS